MKDGADGEVRFEIFEGLFDGHKLDVVLPKSRGIAFDEIGAQQIAAFTAADFTQLAAVEREGEVGRGLLDRDVGQAPGDRSLGTSGPSFISNCSRVSFIAASSLRRRHSHFSCRRRIARSFRTRSALSAKT